MGFAIIKIERVRSARVWEEVSERANEWVKKMKEFPIYSLTKENYHCLFRGCSSQFRRGSTSFRHPIVSSISFFCCVFFISFNIIHQVQKSAKAAPERNKLRQLSIRWNNLLRRYHNEHNLCAPEIASGWFKILVLKSKKWINNK